MTSADLGPEAGDRDTGAPDETRRPAGDLIVQVSASHVAVEPGTSASVTLEVTNAGAAIDGLTPVVDGIDVDWVSTDRPMVAVFPDETERITLTLDVPTSCPAGDYLVMVRLLSELGNGREGAQDFWLTVGRHTDVRTTLRPSVVRAGPGGRTTATVENLGNADTSMRVTALDPTRECEVRVDPGGFFVPTGGRADVDIEFTAKRPWFGQSVSRTILVTTIADPHEADPVTDEQVLTFDQRPRIPAGLITILILAGIIALWAVIFYLAINGFRSQQPTEKTLGSSFSTAPTNIPLDVVAATAGGTVSVASTGEGVPRATVEAVQIDSDGNQVTAASAASGAEGLFEIPTLLPGDYFLRVTADGFDEAWTPAAPTEAGAMPITFGAGEVQDDLDVLLQGQDGTLSGQLQLPPEAAGQELMVEASRLPNPGDSPPETDGATGEVSSRDAPVGPDANGDEAAGDAGQDASDTPETFTTTTTDGTILLTDLPAPANYEVTVSGEGFDPITFIQEVRPGVPTVMDTVEVTAKDGTLAGTVRDTSGSPLGDVSIRASSGAVVQTTSSASADGRFQIIGVPTPGTYVLSFERDGFAPTSISLFLDPGAPPTDLNITMVGGFGSIDGVVRSTQGVAIGGVTVEVVGDGFRQETATLTGASAGGVVGGFSLRDIPVPGAYTLTFTADGFLPETRAVLFDTAGRQPVGDVTLVPSSVRVSGTVLSGGTGLAQATVSLSNGLTTVSTLSATSPAGSFAFDGVAEGTYTLTATGENIVDHTVLVQVVAGNDVIQNVTVQPAPAPASGTFVVPGIGVEQQSSPSQDLFAPPSRSEP